MDENSARIPVRSRRQAMDWSLALVSQEIETVIDSSAETGWSLLVAAEDHERALAVLRQYQQENRRWPWRQKISAEGVLFDWGSLAWAALLGLFFWLSERSPAFHDAGVMDGTAVSHGAWWRLFTAIFLHADPGHLAGNVGIGVILLGLVMGRYGTGIGLLAAYLAGAGGNVATWMVDKTHLSIGASGMVMGCVGLLAAQSVSISRKNPQALKYVFSGVAGGVMLFVLTGTSPGTDVLAHFGGFVAGLLLGVLLTLAPRLTKNAVANIFAGVLFSLLVICSWWLAFRIPGN